MFSNQQTINALERFPNNYLLSDHHIQGMIIDTILQLVRHVFDSQYFVDNYKLYKQIAREVSDSLLRIPLVYINLFYWQQDLLDNLINNNELFFRYQEEAFITWNRSEDELHSILTMANIPFPQPI